MRRRQSWLLVFFFNDTATTEIYTLSLHDALPICRRTPPGSPGSPRAPSPCTAACTPRRRRPAASASHRRSDRKSTRLNSSHANISYAVFCLKKKNNCTRLDDDKTLQSVDVVSIKS